jgi:hypothetical protein
MVTASSLHGSGVHLVAADGSVHYISIAIEPRVWWAMGSRNGAESGVDFE